VGDDFNEEYTLIILILSTITVSIFTINSSTSHFYSDSQNLSDLKTSPQNASAFVIGASYIRVPENAKVITQVDRVIKDTSSNININTPQVPKTPEQLVPTWKVPE
jgi:hypothetical protein